VNSLINRARRQAAGSAGSAGGGIIEENLVWHFDAANASSYPGSGTAWSNLITGGPDGTLVNGAAYSTDGGGSIELDGVDDRVTIGTYVNPFTDAMLPNPCTVEFWVSRTSGATAVLFGHISFSNGGYFPALNPSTIAASNGTYGTVTYTVPTDGTFERVTLTRDGANVEVFINAVSKGTITINATNNLIGSTLGSFLNGGFSLTGKVAEFNVYDVALSAGDITSNFNNTKSRYGY